MKENGALLQRISLADLASYLGITQVSLSRIRAMK
ncbi:DNA-binding Xre family transcriptional regulator [Chryseobacterium sp. SORGH_AS909]|uniref:DNA-binding Xre family transcriptional regulator n=1 Tax=Chryseobacterium camelliae TaxID=1265445 RepID=A0ABU0TI73_9FLAO|nr:DNA-binding Xre family transcriptional regulator [Chryseobacterium camelliae]MDQ1100691.1 DNA-binding Xre family transcriptional regulator [Chryseobacterium sp. SORGH_AS_1048]MDR6088029.1 DNA-binding Xre family transcriptional regulator [Chryseobacterium sp. SORGH_AS_0909]MDR6132404.1 DNA-binding Xre family transcriptional regulator [Chryseobacterium sp. SORGH_AS_1175]MDT3409387.1 DNA-binding Xre family transcriptional regulator [Pseudacidovorax intermedius]